MSNPSTPGIGWLMALSIMVFTCSDQVTEPVEEDPVTISDVINIVWTLETNEIAGQPLDLTPYEPFNLVFGDSLFQGDDGCNAYGGTHEVEGDSVFPSDWWITEIGCPDIQAFPADHLFQPFRYVIIGIDSKELGIWVADTVYTYRSNFLSYVDSLIIDRSWVLTSSTDPQISEVLREEVRITLDFDLGREFEANWDCTAGTDAYGCGWIGGFYGIGENRSILFYKTTSGGTGVLWYEYLGRILGSSSYQADRSVLVLSDSAAFEFSLSNDQDSRRAKLSPPENVVEASCPIQQVDSPFDSCILLFGHEHK